MALSAETLEEALRTNKEALLKIKIVPKEAATGAGGRVFFGGWMAGNLTSSWKNNHHATYSRQNKQTDMVESGWVGSSSCGICAMEALALWRVRSYRQLRWPTAR